MTPHWLPDWKDEGKKVRFNTYDEPDIFREGVLNIYDTQTDDDGDEYPLFQVLTDDPSFYWVLEVDKWELIN